MNGYLRQSTASQVRTVGPFVDDVDFKSLENALSIANTDIKIKKNGAGSGNKNSGGATADGAGGLYHLTWDATDTNTVGELFFSIKVAGALVVFGSYVVLEEAVYDALYAANATGVAAAGALEATAQSILTDTAEIGAAGAGLTNINLPNQTMDITGNITGNLSGSVGSVTGAVGSIATGGIVAASFAANAINAAKLDPDVTTELQAGLATASALSTVSGNVDAILLDTVEIGAAGAGLTAINLPDQTMNITGNITGNLSGSVNSVTTGVTLAASAVQAIWDALTSALTTAGSIGKLLVDNVNATISSRATPAQVNTEADQALADVGVTTTVTGRIDAAITTRATPAQVATELATYDAPTKAELDTGLDALPTALENADALLNRDMSAVSDSNARTPLNALRFLRNRWSIATGTLTVRKEDDSTSAWTAPVTTDGAAEPIIEVDPT